jgi:hypothetical protein
MTRWDFRSSSVPSLFERHCCVKGYLAKYVLVASVHAGERSKIGERIFWSKRSAVCRVAE